MKILILEDDEVINESLSDYFEWKGHVIDSYLDGETLLNSICPNAYDIFLLDINTPNIDGFDVLKELRKNNKKTPAIFITALSDLKNIEKAYSLSCNDYVKKPFSIRELELKVNALTKNQARIKINQYYNFDKEHMQLFYEDKEVELSKNEKLLLNILINNLNTTVDSDAIVSYIWEYKNISDNTLRTQIKKIRKKLNSDFIKNIRGRGYKIESNI